VHDLPVSRARLLALILSPPAPLGKSTFGPCEG
jgi:hypothetical protein